MISGMSISLFIRKYVPKFKNFSILRTSIESIIIFGSSMSFLNYGMDIIDGKYVII